MKVLKFGGSSLANSVNIGRVAEIVKGAARSNKCIVVLSAMQGITDKLVEAGRSAERGDDGCLALVEEIRAHHTEATTDLFPAKVPGKLKVFIETAFADLENILEGVIRIRELSGRTLDRLLSFGELASSMIVAEKLAGDGIESRWMDSRLFIKTDDNYGFASVDFEETNQRLQDEIGNAGARVLVFPGFIASGPDGATTTLGRGGSDYTASIIAAAVDAEILEIWTDVNGMMTADPRFVKAVKEIPRINYREAMELSHFGAKVIYPPTIQPVMAKGIPLLIKNTFDPDHHGTLIEAETDDPGEIIRGITSIDNIAVLNLEGSGMVGVPGFSKRLFDALWRSNINVILITQSSSEHSISVAVEDKQAERAKQSVDREFENEIAVGKIEPLRVEKGFSILALVGDNMKAHTGVSGRMFMTLGHNGINIHAIAQGSSERNISSIISSEDVRKAVNALHEEFFSDGTKQVNVFIAGVGNVGKKLLEQLGQQRDYLAENLGLNLRVVGAGNSRSAVYSEDGIEPSQVEELLARGASSDIEQFADEIIRLNLRNSVFVDLTASPEVVKVYSRFLGKSISVVACNKIACSSDHEQYKRLRSLALEFNTNFSFETNVGAGLPVISTLNDLLRSGDRIRRIEAVLSGTLNFVFNNYDGSRPFAEVVRQAQDEGYTEPDPRLDLSGTDVARKILILARESGYDLEMSDVENVGFLPKSCLEGATGDFYRELGRYEEHFRRMLDEANAEGTILKYIASFADGRARVGLEPIWPEHDFARLSGKDNAVLFYTDRYSEQPLMVKGAGAGAEVTAAGVFGDVIRAAIR
jgi:bifunctional aspartokinase / homoserine dehydrogenase 1